MPRCIMALRITILSIMAQKTEFGLMSLRIIALSVTELSITTLSITVKTFTVHALV